jgi:hypothetical protein
MQITLLQHEIEQAITNYIDSQGISTAGKRIEIQLKVRRKNHEGDNREMGTLATVDIVANDAPVALTPVDVYTPPVEDVPEIPKNTLKEPSKTIFG